MKKIKVAILGGGVIASKYLDILVHNSGVSLEGICGRTYSKAENLKKKYRVKKIFKNINDLYYKTEADIIISTVSVENIFKTSKNLLNFPWTIFIEKPPGLNLKEFIQLKRLSNLKRKKIFVGMNRRYFSSTLALLNEIKKQKDQRTIHIFDQQDTQIEKIKKTPKKIIYNWMYANAIHTIDYAIFLTRGKIKKIIQVKKNKKDVNFIIHFSSGDMVNYISRWNKPGPWQVKMSTNNYYYELSPLEILKSRSNNSRKFKIFEISENDKKFKTGFKLQVDDLIKAHQNKKNNLTTLNDLEHTMRLINKIYSR